MGSIIKVNEYKDFGNNAIMTSDGAGVITLNNDALKMAPVFSARKSGDTSISDATATKITFDTEIIDSNGAYSSDRFTVPSGYAGTYWIQSQICCYGGAANSLGTMQFLLYKNGSSLLYSYVDPYTSNQEQDGMITLQHVLDLVAGDYLELYANIDSTSGGSPVINGNPRQSIFSGYRITGTT